MVALDIQNFSSRDEKYSARLLRSHVKYFSTVEEKIFFSAQPINILYRLFDCLFSAAWQLSSGTFQKIATDKCNNVRCFYVFFFLFYSRLWIYRRFISISVLTIYQSCLETAWLEIWTNRTSNSLRDTLHLQLSDLWTNIRRRTRHSHCRPSLVKYKFLLITWTHLRLHAQYIFWGSFYIQISTGRSGSLLWNYLK